MADRGVARGIRLIALAAVAGIVAGAFAVYFSGRLAGNPAAAVDCAGALTVAERVAAASPRARSPPSRSPASRTSSSDLAFKSAGRLRRDARRVRRARRSSSTSGRPGACRAGARCPRSTGWSRRSAARISRWWRSTSTSATLPAPRPFSTRSASSSLAFYSDPDVQPVRQAQGTRPRLRAADHDPDRPQGLPDRRRRRAGGVGFGRRQAAHRGRNRRGKAERRRRLRRP